MLLNQMKSILETFKNKRLTISLKGSSKIKTKRAVPDIAEMIPIRHPHTAELERVEIAS
jgi:hypothetical protein